jgi:hypothetical protein
VESGRSAKLRPAPNTDRDPPFVPHSLAHLQIDGVYAASLTVTGYPEAVLKTPVAENTELPVWAFEAS